MFLVKIKQGERTEGLLGRIFWGMPRTVQNTSSHIPLTIGWSQATPNAREAGKLLQIVLLFKFQCLNWYISIQFFQC